MRKILATGIIAMLLCSTLVVLAQAQSTNTQNNKQAVSTASVNESTNMTAVENAIADHLSGKTSTFYVPGAIQQNGLGTNNPLDPQVPDMPLPAKSGGSSSLKNVVIPLNSGSGLYVQKYNSSNYQITYMVFGNGTHSPASVDGVVNCLNNLQNSYIITDTTNL
jgi:hypothetical protein